MTLFHWGIVAIAVFAIWPIAIEVVLAFFGRPTNVLPYFVFYTFPGAIIALVLWLLGFVIYWYANRPGGGV